jgi:hypothetical protein
MWSGSLFDFSLKRLLILYFRGKLAPTQEQYFADTVKQRSLEAQAGKALQQSILSRGAN